MAEKKDGATKVKNPLAEAQNWEQRVKTELEVNISSVLINRGSLSDISFYSITDVYFYILCFSIYVFFLIFLYFIY